MKTRRSSEPLATRQLPEILKNAKREILRAKQKYHPCFQEYRAQAQSSNKQPIELSEDSRKIRKRRNKRRKSRNACQKSENFRHHRKSSAEQRTVSIIGHNTLENRRGKGGREIIRKDRRTAAFKIRHVACPLSFSWSCPHKLGTLRASADAHRGRDN